MTFCWLGIHKWNKWEKNPNVYEKIQYYRYREQIKERHLYHFHYMERTCIHCGKFQQDKIKGV